MTKEQIAAIAQKYANEVYPGGYTEYTAILLAIKEALEQASQPQVPEGFKLVPIKPTSHMCEAVSELLMRGVTRTSGPTEIYNALLAAAPEQASQPQDEMIANMAMLLRRLLHSPDNTLLQSRVREFLRRNNLEGSPLRESTI